MSDAALQTHFPLPSFALPVSNTASTCDWVSLHLNEHGVDCLNISGQQHYKLRQGRWHAFLAGQTAVLSCTDLVSRGLDSCHVSHSVSTKFRDSVRQFSICFVDFTVTYSWQGIPRMSWPRILDF